MMKLFQTLMVSLAVSLAAFLLLCVTVASAQQPAASPAAKPAVPVAAANPAAKPATASAANPAANPAAKPGSAAAPVLPAMTQEEMNRPFRGSFFLSPLEIAAIQQALSGRVIKAPTLAEETKPIVPSRRVIRISGVLYRSPQNWIVWMNNQKVTPDNLLEEIVDISVKDSSKVSLEWYDKGLNEVLSITLRPHQTYDITTGILLPK